MKGPCTVDTVSRWSLLIFTLFSKCSQNATKKINIYLIYFSFKFKTNEWFTWHLIIWSTSFTWQSKCHCSDRKRLRCRWLWWRSALLHSFTLNTFHFTQLYHFTLYTLHFTLHSFTLYTSQLYYFTLYTALLQQNPDIEVVQIKLPSYSQSRW